jgi:hypothetical protein
LSKFKSCRFNSPLYRPDYPDIFPDSPDFSEYPEKYPESPDLGLTAAKKFVIFRFDYSPPPSSRHLDPFNMRYNLSQVEAFPGKRNPRNAIMIIELMQVLQE